MNDPLPRRAPTLAAFVALGLFWGAWASVLPSVQRATHASKGTLGLALAGAATGATDVAMNACAGRIESGSGRKLMPLAHGLYSVGVLAGAVGAGLARAAGSGREPILLAVALIAALVSAWTATDSGQVSAPEAGGLRFAHALLLIGLVGAAAFIVEGGIESWSALSLERQLHAHPAISGLGPGLFGGSMAAGRFFGQGTRRSNRFLLVAGGLIAMVGCTLAAVAPNSGSCSPASCSPESASR